MCHVMVRGNERRATVKDNANREAFVAGPCTVAYTAGTTLYGCAPLSNHLYILLRSSPATS